MMTKGVTSKVSIRLHERAESGQRKCIRFAVTCVSKRLVHFVKVKEHKVAAGQVSICGLEGGGAGPQLKPRPRRDGFMS